MNCNCLTDVKAKLTEHAVNGGAVNPRLSEDFLGINMGTGDAIISMTYTVRADNRPYNAANGKALRVSASFCPFCGKPVKKEAT